MEKPTVDEIKKFIDVFDQLCKFEADHRSLRGHGLFDSKDLPIPEVTKVSKWLRSKVEISEKDKFESLLDKYEKISDTLHVKMSLARESNNYIEFNTLEDEAKIYENVIKDLIKLGGYNDISKN